MHVGLLTMRGEKMSKSLGNVFGLDAAMDAFGPETLRFYYLNATYRAPLEFDPDRSLAEAHEAYGRLSGPAVRLREASRAPEGERALDPGLAARSAETVERLDALLADDFQTREAIAELFGWGRVVNEQLPGLGELDASGRADLAAPFEWAAEVLGLLGPGASEGVGGVAGVGTAIAARSRARSRGDYAEADRIRADLRGEGIELEDGAGGTRWRRAGPGGS